MEKLKEQSQQRSKREVGDNDPSYMISKGPFSLNEDTLYDGPVIELKGPQQDQSKLVEIGAEKERKEEGKICRLIGTHRVDEWNEMNEWMDRRTDGPTDGRMDELRHMFFQVAFLLVRKIS